MILAFFRKVDGKVLRWAVMADPKMHLPREGEDVLQIPPDYYYLRPADISHVQRFVTETTGLDPTKPTPLKTESPGGI